MTNMQVPPSIRKAVHTLLWIGFGMLLSFWLRMILTTMHFLPPFTCSEDGMLKTVRIVAPLIILLHVPAIIDVLITPTRLLINTGSMMADDDASLFPVVRKGRCLIIGVAAYAVLELISTIVCVMG